jgi:MYXO-CTERM domain-containing protein
MKVPQAPCSLVAMHGHEAAVAWLLGPLLLLWAGRARRRRNNMGQEEQEQAEEA